MSSQNNEEEEPNFFEENEEESDKENKRNENCSFDDEIEKEEKQGDLISSMIKQNKNKKENKKIEQNKNNILNGIESDENNNEEKENNSLNSNDKDEDENEPNFYEEEVSDHEREKENEENEEINKEEDKVNKRTTKEKEELKKKNIELENIFDINKEFNYDKDNPVFYLRENKMAMDKYPWPLSTKQIVNIIKKDNIPYKNLKVKLVDLFEFKLKVAYEYVDFINVIKPEWASNVTFSKIFLDLYKFKFNKENNKEDTKEKNDEKKDLEEISQSKIPKVSITNTFSVEKKMMEEFNKKEEEIYENRIYNDKNRNFWPKRGKKKRGRGRGRGTEIRGGFSYE